METHMVPVGFKLFAVAAGGILLGSGLAMQVNPVPREPEPQPWRSDEPPAGWFFSKGRRRRWRRR